GDEIRDARADHHYDKRDAEEGCACRRNRRRWDRYTPRDGRDEPVAAPSQRLDESRILRRVIESLAKFSHRGVEAVVEVDEFRGPQALAQLFAGDDGAGALEQKCQKTEGLLLQLHLDSVPPQLRRP